MNSPSISIEPRITREEMEKSFRPCCWCGQVERLVNGVYKIAHDYSRHPGMENLRKNKSERVA